MEPGIDDKGGMAATQGGIPADASVTPDKPIASAQLRGEVMAFAAQSAAFNLAANVFEPYINYRVQKHFAAEDAQHHKIHGNYTQNLAGEFAGDLTGAAVLMLAELLCPDQLHRMSRRCREFVDPLYESVAHRVFAKEAGSPDYDTKVHAWKTFQERNLVRSAIVAAGGVAGNLATQKWLVGNPSPTGVIFAGKMASTAISTAMGLMVRLAFPRQMDALDARISSTFFAPFLDDRHLDTAAPEAATGAVTRQAERLRRMTDEYMGLAR